eukprot:scaffold57144_cov66-Phaeocystis_antarctica.AAC.6
MDRIANELDLGQFLGWNRLDAGQRRPEDVWGCLELASDKQLEQALQGAKLNIVSVLRVLERNPGMRHEHCVAHCWVPRNELFECFFVRWNTIELQYFVDWHHEHRVLLADVDDLNAVDEVRRKRYSRGAAGHGCAVCRLYGGREGRVEARGERRSEALAQQIAYNITELARALCGYNHSNS